MVMPKRPTYTCTVTVEADSIEHVIVLVHTAAERMKMTRGDRSWEGLFPAGNVGYTITERTAEQEG